MMHATFLSRDWQFLRRRWLVGAAIIFVTVLIFTTTNPTPKSLRLPSFQTVSSAKPLDHLPQANQVFTKPKGIPVVGLVFYGRKSRVEILRCYIEVLGWAYVLVDKNDS
jgi:hypothetical protein